MCHFEQKRRFLDAVFIHQPLKSEQGIFFSFCHVAILVKTEYASNRMVFRSDEMSESDFCEMLANQLNWPGTGANKPSALRPDVSDHASWRIVEDFGDCVLLVPTCGLGD